MVYFVGRVVAAGTLPRSVSSVKRRDSFDPGFDEGTNASDARSRERKPSVEHSHPVRSR
jgi:hypothetical protein